jgi:hypothetical protein
MTTDKPQQLPRRPPPGAAYTTWVADAKGALTEQPAYVAPESDAA